MIDLKSFISSVILYITSIFGIEINLATVVAAQLGIMSNSIAITSMHVFAIAGRRGRKEFLK